jgi:hypothetical protein
MARPWACPSRTGWHPGPHAGVSRPCGEHRMRADCRAHAPTLATAPGPALQPIGHPHRDLRPGQVHQRASGPACHADRGAAAPSHPIRAGGVATGLRCRYASGMPQCPDRGCHRLEMRSQRRSPAASPSRAAVITSAAATLSGFSRARRNIPSSVRAGIPTRRRPDLLSPRRPAVARPTGACHGPCLAQGHAAARLRDARRPPASHRTRPESCHRPPGQRRRRRRPDPHPACATRRRLPAPTAVTSGPGALCGTQSTACGPSGSCW